MFQCFPPPTWYSTRTILAPLQISQTHFHPSSFVTRRVTPITTPTSAFHFSFRLITFIAPEHCTGSLQRCSVSQPRTNTHSFPLPPRRTCCCWLALLDFAPKQFPNTTRTYFSRDLLLSNTALMIFVWLLFSNLLAAATLPVAFNCFTIPSHTVPESIDVLFRGEVDNSLICASFNSPFSIPRRHYTTTAHLVVNEIKKNHSNLIRTSTFSSVSLLILRRFIGGTFHAVDANDALDSVRYTHHLLRHLQQFHTSAQQK